MELEGEMDPEIMQRHQAVYDDLMNEIDGLESDEEDGGGGPKPVVKPKQNTAPAKKIKTEPKDDFDFGMGKGGDDPFAELEKGLGKKMKNEIDDLENELNALNSDEDDDTEDHTVPSHNLPQKMNPKPASNTTATDTQFKKPNLEAPPKKVNENMGHSGNSQNQSSVSTATGTSTTSTKTSGTSGTTSAKGGLPYPIKHFVGKDDKPLIALDNKFHGKDNLKTLALIDHEIKEVINPCLASDKLSEEMKEHLEAKKKSLELFKTNFTKLFEAGKLNAKTYIPLINQMKTANLNAVKELQAKNATGEVERIKKRLLVVVNEEKEYESGHVPSQTGTSQSSQAKSTATSKNTQSQQSKQPALADSIKPTKEESSLPSSEIDGLSDDEVLALLKKRKDQYWNLANYLNKELIKFLDKAEADHKKQELNDKLIPLIQQAGKYITSLEAEEDVVDQVKSFLKKQLLEVSPTLLHGKSFEQRSQQLDALVQAIQKCIDEESAYTEKLRAMSDSGDKKVQAGEALIKKYNEYIDYIKKLNDEKVKWIPVPKIGLAKDQRTLQLVNKDIPGHSLFVQFKQLHNITPRAYYIKWSVETANGTQTYETPYCDASSQKFNYQQMVQLTTKEKLDQNIENQGIHLEICFKKLFIHNKKCEATIPFAPFRKINTVDEKRKLRDDGLELSYVLKVREPLLKYSKSEITMIQDFKIFPEFKRDAPVPQASTQKPATNQAKPVPKEEAKKEEPKPAAGLFEKKKYPPLVLLKQTPDPLANVPESEYPAGITKDYVLDPANPDIVDCLGVLKKMAEELEKARPMLAAEGRRADNKIVSDNWGKALKKATILETKFGEGEIDPVQYCEILKNSMARDKKLLEFYKAKGDQDRLAFTAEKAKLTMGELKELEEALAGQGQEE